VGQEVSVALLTSEFDKLGLRVGEAFSSFESRSNIGKINVLKRSGYV
jgi:hypothetical protein